jgi:HK97 family phage major capsid protein
MMHPTDIANMHLSKDTIGQYILPPFVAANGLEVDGMKVLSSFDLTQDTFLVGDSTKAKLFSKRGLQVRMWEQVGEDPLYDQVTFTGSLRAAFRVKVLERYAFVTGTFTAAISTL